MKQDVAASVKRVSPQAIKIPPHKKRKDSPIKVSHTQVSDERRTDKTSFGNLKSCGRNTPKIMSGATKKSVAKIRPKIKRTRIPAQETKPNSLNLLAPIKLATTDETALLTPSIAKLKKK